MFYYKDAETGTFPAAYAERVDTPELVEIERAEYETICAAGLDRNHPMRPEVRYAEEIAKLVAETCPPPGTVIEPVETPEAGDAVGAGELIEE